MYLVWEYLTSILIVLLIATVLLGFSLLFLVAQEWAKHAAAASQRLQKRVANLVSRHTDLAQLSPPQHNEQGR